MTEYNLTETRNDYASGLADAYLLDEPRPRSAWHVLWTRSNCERLVHDQLVSRGYEAFLPMIQEWKGGGRRDACLVPMFKGYLFVRHAVDKESYIDICKSKGLVSILGARWDRLAQVPAKEIETIRLTVSSRLPAMPYPYLEEGDKVRITRGSLAKAEGVLVRTEPSKGLFVVSVNLLRRSVAVEVDFGDVEPV